MAEIEFSVLSSQCLGRRIGDIETFCNEVKAWQDARNAKGKGADWQFMGSVHEVVVSLGGAGSIVKIDSLHEKLGRIGCFQTIQNLT